MQEEYSLSASRLMEQCAHNLQQTRGVFIESSASGKILKKTKTVNEGGEVSPRKLFKELNKISPQEEEENDRIIEKLRRKATKKQKEVCIRKTDLGENEMIFNEEEMRKLRLIDEYELLGIECEPQEASDSKYQINAQNCKLLGSSQNNEQEIKRNLEWVDREAFRDLKNKNMSKVLKFQKRENPPADHIWPKAKSTNAMQQIKKMEHSKLKGTQLSVKKNSVDHKFLNTLNDSSRYKILSKREKLANIIKRVNKRVEAEFSKGSYVYMTENRKQAIYECELLRSIKSQLGPKFYAGLQLKIQEFDSLSPLLSPQSYNSETINHRPEAQDFNKQNDSTSFYSSAYSGPTENCSEAERVLQKNRNRIRDQRRRVIQKMMC